MKHATPEVLRGLSGLLDQIRQRDGLKEKKLGIFYKKSKSFLHFHEDPAGVFADLSAGAELWTNIPNSGAAQAGRSVHVCFHAPSCESVNEVSRAALAGAEK
jgi:hypothetical protein